MTTSEMGILPSWIDPSHLIQSAGPWAVIAVMAILFAECGLLIGFFLPGDTLLFISGLFLSKAAAGNGGIHTNIVLFIALVAFAAFAGNMVGYSIGRKFGPAVFSRPNAKVLKHEYIERSEAFFAKYGKLTVVLARFVPVVRTISTVMAGASKMNVKLYMIYSALGGLLWVGAVVIAGYFLGKIQFIADNVDLIFVAAVVAVVCVSAVPALLHIRQSRRTSGQR